MGFALTAMLATSIGVWGGPVTPAFLTAVNENGADLELRSEGGR